MENIVNFTGENIYLRDKNHNFVKYNKNSISCELKYTIENYDREIDDLELHKHVKSEIIFVFTAPNNSKHSIKHTELSMKNLYIVSESVFNHPHSKYILGHVGFIKEEINGISYLIKK